MRKLITIVMPMLSIVTITAEKEDNSDKISTAVQEELGDSDEMPTAVSEELDAASEKKDNADKTLAAPEKELKATDTIFKGLGEINLKRYYLPVGITAQAVLLYFSIGHNNQICQSHENIQTFIKDTCKDLNIETKKVTGADKILNTGPIPGIFSKIFSAPYEEIVLPAEALNDPAKRKEFEDLLERHKHLKDMSILNMMFHMLSILNYQYMSTHNMSIDILIMFDIIFLLAPVIEIKSGFTDGFLKKDGKMNHFFTIGGELIARYITNIFISLGSKKFVR